MSALSRLAVFAVIVASSMGVLAHALLDGQRTSRAAQGEAIDEQIRLLKERIARKQAIAEQLAAGRITLVEAASQLAALNLPIGFWCSLAISDPDQSPEEMLCRHIMDLAIDQAVDSIEAETLRQRLEKQLRDARDADGRVVLPKPYLAIAVDVTAVVD